MNKVMRGFVMSGVAVAAGLAVSAGPAAAADAAPQPSAKTSAAEKAPAKAWVRDRIVDFYRSPMACHRAGRFGEWRDRWEEHDCIPIRHGFRRGWWALKVYYGHGPGDFHDGRGHDHDGRGHDHDGPGHGPWKKN
jgi:hypothetical protein